MRTILRPTLQSAVWLAALAAAAFLPSSAWAQQGGSQSPVPSATSGNAGAQAAAPSDSLADAARKARDQKKEAKPPRVFTNDNIPTTGGISTVGDTASSSSASSTTDTGTDAGAGGDKKSDRSDQEKTWRERFKQLRSKLAQDTADLDVLQRELGVVNVQYYNDPVKAMQQNLTRDDINKKTAEIDAKKQAIVADQQAIDDAEDDLRKAGGDPGWSR